MSPGGSWDLEKLFFLPIYFFVFFVYLCERNAPWSSIIKHMFQRECSLLLQEICKNMFSMFLVVFVSCVCTYRTVLNCNMFQCECFLAMHQICQSTNPLTHPSASLASLLIWWYSLCHQSTQCICLNCRTYLSKLYFFHLQNFVSCS